MIYIPTKDCWLHWRNSINLSQFKLNIDMKRKIKIFIGNDLDSAGSLMFMTWVFKETCDIDFTISSIFNIKRDYDNFCRSEKFSEYSKIFILNIIPNFKVGNNVFIFSKSDGLVKKTFRGKIGIESSTTKLLTKYLQDKYDELTKDQKYFLQTVDSFYIDGADKNESMKLNAIFIHGKNKYSEFYDRFFNGIGEYSEAEKNIIKAYVNALKEEFKNLTLHEHNTKKGIYIALVENMAYKHEILDLLFKAHSPKIVFLVDLRNGFISARKCKNANINMTKLCDTIIDGRALACCAGGKYTEKFLEFSREFS